MSYEAKPRDGEEIEITTEMVAAGVQALPFLEASAIGSMTEETLVCQVYRAMVEESRRDNVVCDPTRT